MNQIASDDIVVGIVQSDMVGKMATFKDIKVSIDLDVTDCVNHLNRLVYLAISLILHYAVIMITIISVTGNSESRSLKPVAQTYGIEWWHIYSLFVDQEGNKSSKDSKRIIWFFICFGVFVVIHGVLLNLMSTDLVAEKKSENLDYLKDLLDNPIYKYNKLGIIKDFFLYSFLMQSTKNRRLKQLKD